MFRLQGELRLTILFPDQTWLRGLAVRFDPVLGLLTKSCLSSCQAASLYTTLFCQTILVSFCLTSAFAGSYLVLDKSRMK